MSGLSQLMFDGRTSGVKNLTQSAAAQNASVTIDGIAISKASNTITDAIEGVTLNLLKPNTPARPPSRWRATAPHQERGGEFRQGLQRRTRRSRIFPPITRRPSRRPSSGRQRRALDPVGASQPPQLGADHGRRRPHDTSDIGIAFQTDGTLKLDSANADGGGRPDQGHLHAVRRRRQTDRQPGVVRSATSSTKAGNYALNLTLPRRARPWATSCSADHHHYRRFERCAQPEPRWHGGNGDADRGRLRRRNWRRKSSRKSTAPGVLSAAGSVVTVSLASGALSITVPIVTAPSKIESIGQRWPQRSARSITPTARARMSPAAIGGGGNRIANPERQRRRGRP